MIGQRRIRAILFCAAVLLHGLARGDAWDPPAGYYDDATGTGSTLKGQLTTIMSTGHIQRTYGNVRDSAAITDQDPNNANNILLMYNRASVSKVWNDGVTWNREHIWPVSLQGGDDPNNNTTGHRGDPHAVRPANPTINGNRGNKPFGFDDETDGHGYSETDAEYYFPGDADKGDAARSLFYSATRWSSLGLTLTDDEPDDFEMGDLSSLIAWHYLDAPDTFERRRNHAVYSEAMNPLYYSNNRNAYVDRPEYAWSVFVNQTNDSRITVAGGTTDGNGGSTRNVDLGRVFVGGAVPAGQSLTLNKSGNNGTYFSVTTSDDATSSLSGRHNAFRTNGTDSREITVGLRPETSTATAGLRSGTVTIDNLDVTTGGCGGVGCGANDANDVVNVNLTVLDHARPSFAGGTLTTAIMHDFGVNALGGTPSTFNYSIFNLTATPGFTANMDFDSVTPAGNTTALTTNAAVLAGSLSLAAGVGQTFTAAMSTAALGTFSATYTLVFSDENLAGALSKSITLILKGQVILPGDYNRDGSVDAADYVLWRHTNGMGVTAFQGADGDGNSTINADDFDVWKRNLGNMAGGGAGSGAAPEPTSLVLVAIAIVIGSQRLRRRRASSMP